ncbi:hypothetical protein [Acinetobacter tandoii]|uniref:Uncharacterized protein n=1 Tax=Acinetobacter tandoii DSM 14970 = CIP 107469 TaxID=1120927 RepID=R9BB00_9GAMM|nr:hypothetical protein [Acinetobacter tandoii]EOR09556.1 hypothetical protein I593_00962 [Acinetobacter tandoii DSM 14970 = CIP 107469]
MKKFTTLALSISITVLSGCGGGSGDSTSSTPPSTSNSSSGGSTTLTCNQGILLNSQITGTTIFDEPLYVIDYDYKLEESVPPQTGYNVTDQLYSDEIKLKGQMLYINYNPLYNISLEELENNMMDFTTNHNILNSFGLFTQKSFNKQNEGWPLGYLSSSKGLNISTSQFNDTCNFNAGKLNYDFEKFDLSGKKIADILPSNISTDYPKVLDYIFISDQVGGILKSNADAFKSLLSSNATFPAGSFVYVPKTVIYDENQFYFWNNNISEAKSLTEWVQTNYPQSSQQYKIKKVFNLNVAYTVDTNGNDIYTGADPAIEKDGKIYDGEWDMKGDIISPNYGEKIGTWVNYESKGSYALFNKAGHDFITQQILAYYH